ncbi:MAG: primosomal protein N' [Pyrinomonas methylaliphatogenes]|nr:primosomal protein N' [Pyrinomonas methylaliphatogenes]
MNGQGAPPYVEVAVPLGVRRTFTYRLPLAIGNAAQVGARVRVTFGKQQVTGYIVALHDELDRALEVDAREVREIEELIDAEPLITPEILELTRWISDYYLAPWGEVLKAALPAGANARIERVLAITTEGRDELARLPERRALTLKAQLLRMLAEQGPMTVRQAQRTLGTARVARILAELERAGWISIKHQAQNAAARAKRRKFVRLAPIEEHAAPDAARALTAAQTRVIEALIAADGELPFTELTERARASASTIATLERKGIVKIEAREVRRDPLAGVELPPLPDIELNRAQREALDQITAALDQRRYAAFLLHGITGSGKTEIYIRAMRACLEHGRSALMLVPEIALTPVFSRRLRAHFGDRVAILHSSLSAGERFDEWMRIRRAEARVVIGTRSALFAPVQDLGLIVVDEEHDTSYRQQESPFYHARDAAVMRAHKERATIILGSATPSLESFHNAQTGKYRYIHLPERVGGRPLAQAEVIDMRAVFARRGREEALSDELLEALEETLARREQAIILLNRRGYANFILCRACGERIGCPQCDVTLTYHKRERALLCHYCNFRRRPPGRCPMCQSQHLHLVGEGTEKIEDLLQAHFPRARTARLDRDTTARRRAYEQTIMRFAAHEIDILVGTQMIAKGHDFPKVTLVGVVSVDAGLALPDFRAAERTFQLITQVAGRAGRGDRRGRVLIQTYHPEHYAIRFACAQDYANFYRHEIEYRKAFGYPPFFALASLLIQDDDLGRAVKRAEKLRRALDRANRDHNCRLLGPAPAPIARLRGQHRIQILAKARRRASLRSLIDLALAETDDLDRVSVEIDPLHLM